MSTVMLDRWAEVRKEWIAVAEFLDWIRGDRDREDRFEYGNNTKALMAEFFEVDLAQLETERRALIDGLNAGQAGGKADA